MQAGLLLLTVGISFPWILYILHNFWCLRWVSAVQPHGCLSELTIHEPSSRFKQKMNDYPKVTNVVYVEGCFWCFCFEAAWLQGECCLFCWAPVSKGTTLKKGLNPWSCGWILSSGTLQRFIRTDKCTSVTVIFSSPEARTWLWWNGARGVGTANECVWRWEQLEHGRFQRDGWDIRISYLLIFWLCSYLSPASATVLETGFDFPLYFSVSTQARTLQLLRELYSTMAYFKDDSIVNCSRGAIWLLGWLL